MNKLAAMETFVRIVDKGSLTAAAAALDTSLPSVVRTLAALERELGVRLLNRTTRRIHLTDEGAQYLERCRAILSAVQETEAAFTSGRAEPQGRLAVTASVLFGRRYVAPIVSGFLRRYPKVSAELLFVDRVVDLVEEGIDVAVRIATCGTRRSSRFRSGRCGAWSARALSICAAAARRVRPRTCGSTPASGTPAARGAATGSSASADAWFRCRSTR